MHTIISKNVGFKSKPIVRDIIHLKFGRISILNTRVFAKIVCESFPVWWQNIMSNPNVLMGIQAAAAGDLKRASEYLSAAVQAEPTNQEAWLLLGHCQENLARSRACYQRVLELNPSNELARINMARLDALPPVLAQPVEAKPDPLPAQMPVSPARSKKAFGWALAGLLVVLLLCGLTGWFLARRTGLLAMFVPAATELPHSITLYDGTVITSESGFIVRPDGSIVTPGPTQPVDEYTAQGLKLMETLDYNGAVQAWDKVIQLAPQNDTAFYQRGKCYYSLSNNQNDQTVYFADLRAAASDLQQALLLQPGKLDYLLLRREIITDYAYQQTLRADREPLFELAIMDGRQALTQKMPFAQALYLKRQTAENLIEIGRCQDGLDMLKDVADQTPTNDDFYGGVLMVEAKGQACLGQLDLALQNIDASTFNGSSLEDKAYLKALFLYQAGRSAEARQVIDQTIQRTPTFSGWRYYLLAVLQAETGQMEAVTQDLDTGAGYTWDRNGLYSYAHAKLALADGDQSDGIHWLQHAEATLMTSASPLRQRILKELAALGAQPLQPTPAVDFPGLEGMTTPVP